MCRDLKPENLLITDTGGKLTTVKICDFGLAKDISGSPGGIVDGFIGTLVYSSPEMLQMKPYGMCYNLFLFFFARFPDVLL